jgi:hypothetical protein
MGYIEETGAAQYLRDARILPIYEGTNGIQAMDLVGRKLARDAGEAARSLCAEMRETQRSLAQSSGVAVAGIAERLGAGIEALETATDYLVAADPVRAAAGAAPYLDLFGAVTGGWLLARLALAAERQIATKSGDRGFLVAKCATARAYAEQFLASAAGCLAAVQGGSVLDFPLDQF